MSISSTGDFTRPSAYTVPETAEILRVSEALSELEKVDERLVKVVEMRYFAGLSEPEIAETLGLTDRTVRRDWKRARLLLSLALK